MNARRSNRFLVWAIALSLGAHAVLLFFAQDMTFSEASPAPTPVPSIRIVEFSAPTTPPPTPTPPKPPAARKPASRPRHVAIVPPVLLPTIDDPGPPVQPPASPGEIGSPGPDLAPATDAPIATVPPPSCSDPNQAARAIDPIDPEVPEAAQEAGLSGTTLVKVDLDATGVVMGVSVYQSSGSSLLDGAALGAARRTNYRPQLQGCEPVGGSYIFSANFTP